MRYSRGDMSAVPDAHCHLSLVADPERAVAEAVEAGVSPILAVSMDADEAEAVLALRDRFPGTVLAGVGLHPSRLVELGRDAREDHLRRLDSLAASADFIGEIGLDWKDAPDAPGRAAQAEALRHQLARAQALRLPVNLHTRRADRELVEEAAAFHRATGLGALIHWFTHSRSLSRRCAEAGLFISAGPSTLIDPRQEEVARLVDGSLLVVETDTPVAYGPLGSARPALAARVAAALAASRGEPDLAQSLAENLVRWRGQGR